MKSTRLLIFIILTLVSFSSTGQTKNIYLEMNDQFSIVEQNVQIGAYELVLKINNPSTGDTDYYNFIVNTDFNKSFEDGGVESDEIKLLTIKELKNKTFCEIHEMFSATKTIIFLARKEKNNKIKYWLSFYSGTQRNTVKYKPGKL